MSVTELNFCEFEKVKTETFILKMLRLAHAPINLLNNPNFYIAAIHDLFQFCNAKSFLAHAYEIEWQIVCSTQYIFADTNS